MAYSPEDCLYCSDDRVRRMHEHSALREAEDRFYMATCGAPAIIRMYRESGLQDRIRR